MFSVSISVFESVIPFPVVPVQLPVEFEQCTHSQFCPTLLSSKQRAQHVLHWKDPEGLL